MKNLIIIFTLVLIAIPISSVSAIGVEHITGNILTASASPGEIIALSCSVPYPMLGEPVNLVIVAEGNAGERFNETVTVTDDFHGLIAADGDMTWDSGNVPISHTIMTIGTFPTSTKKIAWYPSVVGNHTFHVAAGSFPEKQFNVSVGFDVEGIIAPSLGYPSIIIKNSTHELSVILSELRNSTEEPLQLIKVELQTVGGTAQYQLQNQTATWRTWITAGESTLQDELVARYNTDSVHDGFYNISVTTAKKIYTWPHAVKIMGSEPTEYTVVQFTDTHIGKYANFANKKKELTRLITYANEHLHPDFLIISGDSVDWYNEKCRRNAFADLREALLTSTAPLFTVPGNHERYGNPLLFLYFPFTNLTPYHRFLNPLNDYSLKYGNVNFVFLDSGYDYSRWEIKRQIWNTTPEGSGLTDTQMYLLEHTWGDSQVNQIIALHHPAVYDKNDTGLGALPNNLTSGNDGCIAFNRAAFINYCVDSTVSLVLAGHSHESHVFTSLGKVSSNSSAWPLFVQTRSSTLSGQNNGGRVVHIKNGIVVSYDYASFK
jgi:predicted MPP superfamily phosphohydrolase